MIPRNRNILRMRNHPVGKERRRNMYKTVLKNGTPFPKPVTYEDIDKEFYEWVEGLGMSYDWKKLPVFKLYSNQRINEYQQGWNKQDENGNLILDFLTVSRENNIKKGEQHGSIYNIPGNRRYPMFIVPVLQDNGTEAYDAYTMRQPYCTDLVYTVTAVSSKMELVNKVNAKILKQFKSYQCYIAPNGYYMSMKLDDVGDNSENGIEDRRYYSQTYKITVRAYIIDQDDFEVTHMESRVKIACAVDGKSDRRKNRVRMEEWENPCNKPEEDERFGYKGVNLIIDFPVCENEVEFVSDFDFELSEVELTNVYDIVVTINGESIEIEDGLHIFNGDNVIVEISRDDESSTSGVVLRGYDKTSVIDNNKDAEIGMDDDVSEENIMIG